MKSNESIIVATPKKVKQVASAEIGKLNNLIQTTTNKLNSREIFKQTVIAKQVVIGGCQYSIAYSDSKYHQNNILGSFGEYFVIRIFESGENDCNSQSLEIIQTNNLWYNGMSNTPDNAIFIDHCGEETDVFEEVFGVHNEKPDYPEMVLTRIEIENLNGGRGSCASALEKNIEEMKIQLRSWKNTERTGVFHCYCGKPAVIRKSKTNNTFYGCANWKSASPKYPTSSTSGCYFTRTAKCLVLSKNVFAYY